MQLYEYCITDGPGKLLDYGKFTKNKDVGAVIRVATDRPYVDPSRDTAMYHSEPCYPDCQTGK